MRDRIIDLDFLKRIQTLNFGIICIKLYSKPQDRKRLPREKVAREEKGSNETALVHSNIQS